MGHFHKGAWIYDTSDESTMYLNETPILFNLQRLESRIKSLEEQVEQLKCKKS